MLSQQDVDNQFAAADLDRRTGFVDCSQLHILTDVAPKACGPVRSLLKQRERHLPSKLNLVISTAPAAYMKPGIGARPIYTLCAANPYANGN